MVKRRLNLMKGVQKSFSVPISYPIILAHGICPFDKIIRPFSNTDNRDDDRFHYFRKIRSTLRQNGFLAFHSRVSWASDLSRRASDLKKEINRITENFSKWPRVHIIAHSMGGLDARQTIYKYQMQDRVASLSTIGTPHLGTAYADWGIKRFGILFDIARLLGLNLDGFKDLTRESCQRFNEMVRDFEEKNGVLYQTFAGVQPLNRIFRPLRSSYRIIWKEEGENDGLVSLRSAMWRKEYFVEVIDADHFNQIGWWNASEAITGMDREAFERDIREFYVKIARGLRD
jgi:triacylglycerol lipase